MAYRPFHEDTRDSDREDKRGAGVRLVGVALEQRRARGKPTGVTGRLIFDPVFKDDDLASLRAFCDPNDPRPLFVEIGFQRGKFARAFCEQNPDVRYLGFEIRRKFCEEADAHLTAGGCENYRLALVDARSSLPELVEPGTLAGMFTFFPDPWWKKKQRKRRLLWRSFVAFAAELLRPGGTLLLKTDVEGYADWAEAEMRAVTGVEVERLADPTAGLPPTQRERRCGIHGRPTWAVVATRLDGVAITVTPDELGDTVDDDGDDDEDDVDAGHAADGAADADGTTADRGE